MSKAPPRDRLKTFWRELRAWLRPPRRLRFTRAGGFFTIGVIALGLATLNTGNNLLYLLLGGLLGLIVVSGWLSEQAIRDVRIVRRTPHGVAGQPLTFTYEVHNGKRQLPTLALELIEADAPISAFLPIVAAGKSAFARVEVTFRRRGVYRLHRFTFSTTFPFGLFVKERDVVFPGTVVVWPRTDRRVREARKGGTRARRSGAEAAAVAGGRGDYRSLRPYTPGDDPRDVHWRSTARYAQPVVREYERDASETLWLALELRTPDAEAAEIAIEITAALAARAVGRGERVALVTNDTIIDAGAGSAQLERVLDALARARVRPDAPPMNLPMAEQQCVLVAAGPVAGSWADVFVAAEAG
ncbi:MAG TPA: DUF58 domain-containing protein [Longimicrobiales bacterium]